jgi:hypothetical protein
MNRALLLPLLTAAALFADCPEGVYKTTEADKKFFSDTVAAVKAALPPAPEGWKMEDRNFVPYVPPSDLCKGSEKEPLITGYTVKYIWVTGEKERAQKLNEIDQKIAAIHRTPLPADQQKTVDELGVKDRDLRWQAKKLAASDKTESDRLYAEAAVFAKQMKGIRDAHFETMKPKLMALENERTELFKSMPTELSLHILVNGSGLHMQDAKPSPAQASAAVTLTGPQTTVLGYGHAWAKDGRALYPKGGSIQKVYGVSVEVTGSPEQAKTLLTGLNGAALNSMIGK